MNHLILLVLCLLSFEIIIRSNYIILIKSTFKVSKKAIHIILNKNVSDHWKENIIPKYSMQMIKYSLQMLLIFLSIIFFLIIADNIFNDFLLFIFSFNGIVESILISFIYAYIRKIITS